MRTKIPRKIQAQRCIEIANDFIRDGNDKEAARNLKVASTLLEMDSCGFKTMVRIAGERK